MKQKYLLTIRFESLLNLCLLDLIKLIPLYKGFNLILFFKESTSYIIWQWMGFISKFDQWYSIIVTRTSLNVNVKLLKKICGLQQFLILFQTGGLEIRKTFHPIPCLESCNKWFIVLSVHVCEKYRTDLPAKRSLFFSLYSYLPPLFVYFVDNECSCI